MKRIILLIALLPVISIAQYYGERSTSQSFENSELYFNSHYLNTFGINSYKDVAAGLIDDPFLNIYINPANIPDLGDSEVYLYVDFRGDRTEIEIANMYTPYYYAMDSYYRPYYDRRWLYTVKSEPEPIVSLGFLTYPLGLENKNIYVGGTYQLLYGESNYYTMPYGIYYSNIYYDSFGAKMEDRSSIPIVDRYSGSDEMTLQGHLFSGFAGMKINDKLNVGLSFNGVFHTREGSYSNISNDEYNTTNTDEYKNHSSQYRLQDYNHFDVSAGVNYLLNEKNKIGVKLGILNGVADQKYDQSNSHFYRSNTEFTDPNWNYSLSESNNAQNWKNDGSTKYIGFDFSKKLKNDNDLFLFYRYTSSNVNTTSSTIMSDTSYYSSKYTYNNGYYRNKSISSLHDSRTGTGERISDKHEGMLNIKWTLTEKANLVAGIYFNKIISKVNDNEPVVVVRNSTWESKSTNPDYPYDNSDSRYLFEDKTLEWRYKSNNWSIQIPIILNTQFDEHFGMMIGISRVLKGWRVTDATTAYFTKREKIENGVTKLETNFGERYTQPDDNYTEEYFDLITQLNLNITDKFKASLLINPEFENIFRVSQWWLSFRAKI